MPDSFSGRRRRTMTTEASQSTGADLPTRDGLIAPADAHNERLVGNVHPPDWVNPEPAKRYNLVVIGAGTAGLVAAAGAAGLGAKVALVERHLMGGDCLNVGCVPSKALIGAARAAANARNAGEFGVDGTENVRVDFGRVMERMRRLRAGISRHDSAARFRELGVDVFLGSAEFDGSGRAVRVGDQELRYRKAVICTGARAAAPPIPGLEEAGCLTNETVFSLTELPPRLAVVGAGPIGCELAQAFARFGSHVSLFETADHVLIREDADAAEIVQRSMLRDGVELFTGVNIQDVRPNGRAKTIRYERNGESRELVCDEILVGVGRAPNVEGLNLEAVEVEYDERSGIKVDDRLRTTNKHIYAAGDVCFPYKFTHTADFLARIVIQNALFLGRSKSSSLTIPWCTYTSPELAHVGLHPHEAAERGVKVRTFTQPLSEVDRAILDGEAEGFVRVHVKEGSDQIVGATIVAAHAGELISEITLAMQHGVGLKKIGQTIHPYPTQAEAIRKLGDQYNRTRLTPFVQRLFSKWLAWTR
jgi:pyruvate/2-oxoglutarate dehydrogenase complex dihydrolipoamide dehydrogenase (E3) component